MRFPSEESSDDSSVTLCWDVARHVRFPFEESEIEEVTRRLRIVSVKDALFFQRVSDVLRLRRVLCKAKFLIHCCLSAIRKWVMRHRIMLLPRRLPYAFNICKGRPISGIDSGLGQLCKTLPERVRGIAPIV